MSELPRQNAQIETSPILRWTVVLGAVVVGLLLVGGSYLAYQNHQASRPPLITSTPSTIGQTSR